MTCHVDKKCNGGDVYDDCLFDHGKQEYCRIAIKLSKQGLGRKDCVHWVNETRCPKCGNIITEEKK